MCFAHHLVPRGVPDTEQALSRSLRTKGRRWGRRDPEPLSSRIMKSPHPPGPGSAYAASERGSRVTEFQESSSAKGVTRDLPPRTTGLLVVSFYMRPSPSWHLVKGMGQKSRWLRGGERREGQCAHYPCLGFPLFMSLDCTAQCTSPTSRLQPRPLGSSEMQSQTHPVLPSRHLHFNKMPRRCCTQCEEWGGTHIFSCPPWDWPPLC